MKIKNRNFIPQFIRDAILYFLLRKKNILIKGRNVLSSNILKSKGSKQFPILITDSNTSGLEMREGCRIYKCNCMGKSGNIKLGRFVSLNGPATTISALINKIEIGSFSSIAEGVKMFEWNHRHNKISTYFMNRNIFNGSVYEDIYSNGPILIEEDVWIGVNCVIVSGVTIGRGSVIGAGSVVTKDIPRYSIAFGNPAKVYKKRFSEEVINSLEESKWWEWEIDTIKKEKDKFTNDIGTL